MTQCHDIYTVGAVEFEILIWVLFVSYYDDTVTVKTPSGKKIKCPQDELMVLSGHGQYPAFVFCVGLFSLLPAVSEIEEEVGMEKCSVCVLEAHPVSVRTNPAMQLSLPYLTVSWLAIFS